MLRTLLMVCVLSVCALVASAEPISYQGQLNDGGQPANGTYEFQFSLFDAEIDGTQVGSTITLTDVQVVGGVFREELDFGAVFVGQELWLSIAVRSAGTADPFTELSPNQHLTQVPKASYATMAKTSMDSYWQEVTNGNIQFGTGVQKVMINRTTPITGTEYFGVHANVTGFGGIYMSTADGGFPMYAYAEGGALRAYTFYRHTNDAWVLWVGGTNVLEINGQGHLDLSGDMQIDGSINTDGDVIAEGGIAAGGPMNAAIYALNTPRTLNYSVSGDTFHSGSNTAYFAGDGVGGAYQAQTGNGWLMAPVHLPEGATIIAMHASYLDNSTGNMTIALQARTFAGLLVDIATMTTSGTSVSVRTMTTSTITDPIVDNTNRAYHLRVSSTAWPGNLLLRIFGVRIEYTINEVQ